jgi:hypothetical protein
MTKHHWQGDSEAEADPSPWALAVRAHDHGLGSRTAPSLTHQLETGGRSRGGSGDRSPGGVGRAERPSGIIPWGNLKGPSRLPSESPVCGLAARRPSLSRCQLEVLTGPGEGWDSDSAAR